jgi:hypothetical protein
LPEINTIHPGRLPHLIERRKRGPPIRIKIIIFCPKKPTKKIIAQKPAIGKIGL